MNEDFLTEEEVLDLLSERTMLDLYEEFALFNGCDVKRNASYDAAVFVLKPIFESMGVETFADFRSNRFTADAFFKFFQDHQVQPEAIAVCSKVLMPFLIYLNSSYGKCGYISIPEWIDLMPLVFDGNMVSNELPTKEDNGRNLNSCWD